LKLFFAGQEGKDPVEKGDQNINGCAASDETIFGQGGMSGVVKQQLHREMVDQVIKWRHQAGDEHQQTRADGKKSYLDGIFQ